MSFTGSVTETVLVAGESVTQTNSYTDSAQLTIDEAVTDSSTDYEINMDIDVSEIAIIYVVSDQAVTLETNSGSVPDETIALAAGVPIVWHTNSNYTNLFATDITSIFITNSSGSTANIKVRVLYDSTA